MPTFLLKYWKILLVLALCAGSFAAGRWAQPTPIATDKTSVVQDTDKEKNETVEHKNDKVTVITKKPDGTVTTTITDHSSTTQKKQESETKVAKSTETTKTPVAPAGDAYRPDYRAGLQLHQPLSLQWQPTYSVEIGYRLLGNLWGTASYNIQEHQAGVGVSIDF